MPEDCPICGGVIDPTPEEMVLAVYDKREHGDPEEIFGREVGHAQLTMHRSCAEKHGLEIKNYDEAYFDLTGTEAQIQSLAGGEVSDGQGVFNLNVRAVTVEGEWRLQADNPFEPDETITKRSLQALLRTVAAEASQRAEDRDVPEEYLAERSRDIVDEEVA
jgi:hypothetical protein